MARFLNLHDDEARPCVVEILEAFRFRGEYREFNLRVSRGSKPEVFGLYTKLRRLFSIDPRLVPTLLPMAGDCTVRFEDDTAAPLQVTRSDDHGFRRPA